MSEMYVIKFQAFMTEYAPKIGGALLVFILGLWAINWMTRLVKRGSISRGFDVSLQSFLASMVNVILKVMLLVTVAGMLGIQTTSFVAILGAAGLAVGLALQGSLSNFAGGVLTLIFKPYKVGDQIEALGQTGIVQEIQIFNTILLTAEQKTVILPNGAVSNGTIVNHSRHGSLRIEISMVMDGKTEIGLLRNTTEKVCANNAHSLQEPLPSMHIQRIHEGDLCIVIHTYCAPEDYWTTYFELQEELKQSFDREGIKFATPPVIQRIG